MKFYVCIGRTLSSLSLKDVKAEISWHAPAWSDTCPCVRVRVRIARLPREKAARGREDEGGSTSERDVMVREEERDRLRVGGRERDRAGERPYGCVWNMRASEKDDASWTRNVASRTSEIGEIYRGGIRLAREKEGFSRRDSEGAISSKPTHIHARVFHTHTHTRARADAHRAVKLAHYRLPDSHHELLEKSIEYKKSPWCARRAEPSLLFHPHLSPLYLSPVLVLALSHSLSLRLPVSFSLSLFCLPFAHLPSLLLAVSLARTRGIRVRRCSRQREGELACIHWRSTEIGGMRARTTAKDGDKDKGSEREVGGKNAGRRRLCANVSDSIEASRTEKERSVSLKERKRREKEERERRETRIVLCAWLG